MLRFNSRLLSMIWLVAINSIAHSQTLNCSLTTDTQSHSQVSMSRPAYNVPYIDQAFGAKVTRISGDPNTPIKNISGGIWGNVVHHHYSKDQAWNSDGSLIYIDTNEEGGTGPLFLDGNTYAPLFQQSAPSNSDVRWSKTDPNLMFYAANNSVGYWNVRTDAVSVIRTFSGYSDCKIGPWEGNLSLDGSMVAISCTASSTGHPVGFAYNINTNTKYPDMDIYNYGQTMMDAIQISPKGNYLVASYGPYDEQLLITDLNGKVVQDFYEYGKPSHFDLTVDANGDEVAVGVAKSGAENGKVIKRRLRDGAITVLTPAGGYATHTSARNTALPGFVFTGFAQDSSAPYNNEIVISALDGSKVYRVAQTHNYVSDYKTESHGSASPDGMRVIFKSTWGSSRPVQVYVADIRGKCGVQPTPSPSPTPTASPTPTPVPTPAPTSSPSALGSLISQGKPASASSNDVGSTASMGNDGDLNSRWVAGSGTFPQSYKVDLGGSYDLSSVAINNTSNAYLKYKIEVSSDNVNFTTVVDKTGNTVPGAYSNAFSSLAKRYVRVTITGATAGYWANFYEFQVFGSIVRQVQLLSQGKPASASSNDVGSTASLGNDGNINSRWVASSGSFPQSYKVDLGANFDLTSASINNTTNAYLKYRIEVSSDNVNFTTVVDKTGNTVAGAYSNAFSSLAKRYVRVTITGATAGYWANFYEFQVFGK
jgi:hypothetical protein